MQTAKIFSLGISSSATGGGALFINGSTILDTTLRAVTDQAGTLSPLQLSTTLAKVSSDFIVGAATTASARIQVRGDGTNPITRFEATDGVLFWSLNSTATIQRLGGTTSAFPAIKRNGASIDFRLADDSAFCPINIGGNSASIEAFTVKIGASYGALMYADGRFTTKGSGKFGDTNGYDLSVASAILQADSTTRGFLPPRMTTAQKNAISSPATGLVVFDTDLGKLCVFSVTWQTVTSV